MRKLILASLLVTSSMTVTAQPAFAKTEAAEATAVAEEAGAAEASDAMDQTGPKDKFKKELEDMEKLFSKIFDTKNLPPIEPARLTLAQQTTAKVMPDGVYGKMMNDMMDKFTAGIFNQEGGMSDLEISLTTGVEAPEGGLDEAKRKAITDILDPNHAKRTEVIQSSLSPMINKIAAVVEKPMREGLTRAYARKFTAAQLTELNAFLSTPTGTLFGTESILLQADPEVMQAVFKALPKMVDDLTDPATEIDKKMSEIPPTRSLSDLTAKEKDSVAKLLGTTADKLNEYGGVEEGGIDEATAAAADPFAGDTGEEPWWDRSNWDKADEKKMTELETKSGKLAEQSTEASNATLDFENEVMLRVRERYLAKGWKRDAATKAESSD